MSAMIPVRERFRAVGLVLLAVSTLNAGDSAATKSEFRKQVGTVGAIRGVMTAVDAYRETNKTNPPALVALIPSYMLDARALTDAWGRPLAYYATETHYMLASYGRNGVPDGQLARAGGIGPENDFDQDVVLIDGQWAQSPPNVDR